jgi:hypothetical protein
MVTVMTDAGETKPNTLNTACEIMFFCAVLIAIGSTVVGLILVLHTDPCVEEGTCGGGSTHPLIWPGIGTAVGGYMITALFATVGHIARAVGQLVASTARESSDHAT